MTDDDLVQVEIDIGDDQPDLVAGFLATLTIAIRIDERTRMLPVDHVDLIGGNRARVWVRRPADETGELHHCRACGHRHYGAGPLNCRPGDEHGDG